MARTKREPRADLPLLGATEAGALLGWDRKRVALYLSRGILPLPAVLLASGPVWHRGDLVAFARSHGIAAAPEGAPAAAAVANAVERPEEASGGTGAGPLGALRAELEQARRDRQRAEQDLQRVRADYQWALGQVREKERQLEEQHRELRRLRREMERLDARPLPAGFKAGEGSHNPGTSQAVRTLLEPENVRRLALAHEMAVLADRWDPPGRRRYSLSRGALPHAVDALCVQAVERRMIALGRAAAIAQARGDLAKRDREALGRARHLLRQAFEAVCEGDPPAARRYRLSAQGEIEERVTDWLMQDGQGRPVEEWRPLIRLR